MKTTNLTIPYASEKLEALTQYAAKKELSIEAELSESLDKLYEKYVPAAVREYLAERPQPKPQRPPRPKTNAASGQSGGTPPTA